jgi:hypothetical protein
MWWLMMTREPGWKFDASAGALVTDVSGIAGKTAGKGTASSR